MAKSYIQLILKTPSDEFKRIESNNCGRGDMAFRQFDRTKTKEIWCNAFADCGHSTRNIISFILLFSIVAGPGWGACLCALDVICALSSPSIFISGFIKYFPFGSRCQMFNRIRSHTRSRPNGGKVKENKQHKTSEKQIKEMKKQKKMIHLHLVYDDLWIMCCYGNTILSLAPHIFESVFFDWLQTRTLHITALEHRRQRRHQRRRRRFREKLQTTRVAYINSIFKYLPFKWRIRLAPLWAWASLARAMAVMTAEWQENIYNDYT